MSTMTDIDFPKWLEKKRLEKGWTQSELSRSAGISRQVVSDYEGYKRKYFDEDILKKIAHALKLPAEQVFRAAGLLPPKKVDEEAEELLHKILSLTPSSLAAVNVVIDAFIKEDSDPNSITKKLSERTSKG